MPRNNGSEALIPAPDRHVGSVVRLNPPVFIELAGSCHGPGSRVAVGQFEVNFGEHLTGLPRLDDLG